MLDDVGRCRTMLDDVGRCWTMYHTPCSIIPFDQVTKYSPFGMIHFIQVDLGTAAPFRHYPTQSG